VQPGLFAMAMNTEDSLKEYLGLQLRVPLLGRLSPLARTLDFVANAAPGVKEILTVGKVAYEVRERHYDLVVVDAAATGHITGQLASPKAINDLVHVGMVHDQTQWMLDILHDPSRTGVLIVTTPEEMPVTETIDLAGRLDEETGVDLAAVVVNRVLPELFGRGEEEVFEGLRSSEAEAVLVERAGQGVVAVLDAAHLAVQLRRTRARHLDTLSEAMPPTTPILYVPELFTRAMGMRLMSRVCDALGDELS
jgi:anion-transporting  ArsA/GET3 family ATPase